MTFKPPKLLVLKVLSIATLLTIAATSTRASVIQSYEILGPIAPTTMTNHADETLTLCLRMHQKRLLGLPIWRGATGYALAENNCDINHMSEIDASAITASIRAGLILSKEPGAPKLSLAQVFAGFWGWLALLIPALLVRQIWRNDKKRAQRFTRLD